MGSKHTNKILSALDILVESGIIQGKQRKIADALLAQIKKDMSPHWQNHKV